MKAFCDNCGRERNVRMTGRSGDGRLTVRRCSCGSWAVTLGREPSLNIPDLGPVALIVRQEQPRGLFCRAGDTTIVVRDLHERGRKYNVLRLNHKTGQVSVIGRNLLITLAVKVARRPRSEDGKAIVNGRV